MHFCDRQQLQFVSEHLAEVDIQGTDRGDAFGINIFQIHVRAKGQIDEDRQLVGSVDTAYIERGVRFSIAGTLSFSQNIGERTLLLGHLCQNVIGGSVDDSINRQDSICSQSLFQSLNDRNAAADARLVTDADSGPPRCLMDLGSVSRQQSLVRCNDVFAPGDCGEYEFSSGLIAAD